MRQTDSKEITNILYGIVNGQENAKQSLRNTYMPVIQYISEKYSVDLHECENDIFEYIENGVSEYLFAKIERMVVDYADPFTLWFVQRLQRYFEYINIELPDIVEDLINNTTLLSSIKPVIVENKMEETVQQSENSTPKDTVKKIKPKIKEYPQKQVMSLITLVILSVCIFVYNYMPKIYSSESEGIQYVVTLNKRAYIIGDEVVIKLQLKNITDKEKVLIGNYMKSAPINTKFDSALRPAYQIQPGEEYNTSISFILNEDLDEVVLCFNFNDFITDVSIPLHVKYSPPIASEDWQY